MSIHGHSTKAERDLLPEDSKSGTEVTIRCSESLLEAVEAYGADRGLDFADSILRILKNSLRRRRYLK